MSPHLIRLTSPEDQARCGAAPDTAPRLDPQPSLKTGATERKEQASFANWLLLQNGKGRKIPFSWHATNARSKATPGTPDFWSALTGTPCGSSSSGTILASYRPSKRTFGWPARPSTKSTASSTAHSKRSNSCCKLMRMT
jgi:hypothetical protein